MSEDVNVTGEPEPGDTFIVLRDGVPYVGTYGTDDGDSGEPATTSARSPSARLEYSRGRHSRPGHPRLPRR